MKTGLIEWAEPESVRQSKREEGRARGIARTRGLGWFTLRWTIWLGVPSLVLAGWLAGNFAALIPISIGMLLIALILPVGLTAAAKTEGANLSKWQIDDRGVRCIGGSGFFWKWRDIRSFSIGPHPTVDTVAVLTFETTVPAGENHQHKAYFDPKKIDPAMLMERFTAMGTPAERIWKRIGLGRRRAEGARQLASETAGHDETEG